ncbi:MAG TPA: tetratricopeptide repeat protein [Fimbriimonadaceae bacterium]|nr:tetratricopeptide repeat protein [Fimbriimonadaceae bacterium]
MPTIFSRIWIGLLLPILLAGCGSDTGGRGDIPIIRSPNEYNDANARSAELWQGAAADLQANGELSEQSVKDLREAARLFEGMIAYEPTLISSHSGLGQIYHMLGEYEKAIASLKQAVALPARETPERVALVSQSLHLMSLCHMQLRQYDEALKAAEQAMILVPDHPDYMAAAASAHLQLGNVGQARKFVDAALKVDPANSAARGLDKLLKASAEG